MCEKQCLSSIIHVSSKIGANTVVESYFEGEKPTEICENAEIGSLCYVATGVKVNRNSKIEHGSIVLNDVPPYAIVRGNPAVIIGYTHTLHREIVHEHKLDNKKSGRHITGVKGVTIHVMPEIPDFRGYLSVGEIAKDIPFEVKRYFLVYKVPGKEVRGEHAHKECHQFLICVAGSGHVIVDDGKKAEEIKLDTPNVGIHIAPGVWGIQYKFTQDAVLLVFASENYDSGDYIREYDEFLKWLMTN
ncbi:MAG: WxcM-like domain-containing protein [Bacillota bacterium]